MTTGTEGGMATETTCVAAGSETYPHCSPPLRVNLVSSSELLIHGLRALLEPHPDRVLLVQDDDFEKAAQPVDVALLDTRSADADEIGHLAPVLRSPHVDHCVLYTWLEPPATGRPLPDGIAAAIPKRLTGTELIATLERLCSVAPSSTGPKLGKQDGLSPREAQIIIMIAQGMSNEEIARKMRLSMNTVKSYIRSGYRQIGVTTRAQAVRWAMEHGYG